MPDFVAIAETEDVAELTTAVNDRLSELYDSFEANKIGIVIPGSQTKSGKATRLTVQEVLVPMYGSTKTDTLIDAESILGGTTWTDLTDGGDTTLHKHDIYAALAENEVITGQWLLSAATKLTFRAATEYINSGAVGHLDVEAATSFDVNTILELEATTSTTGHITQAGTRLLHTYGGAGSNNLFAGLGAGNFTLSGAIGNVGLGSGALDSLTSGDYNVAGGFGSAQALTSTSYNTALGGFALGGDAGASYCVAIGYYALYDGQTTIGTTAVGTEAFHNMETGDYGVALGYAAGFYETAGSKLFIDNASRASEADGRVKALIYGVFAAATADQYLTINGHLYAREDSLMIGTAKWQFNAATEYINSGAAGYVDYAAATAHRFAADIAMGGNSITGLSTTGQVQFTATEYFSQGAAGYIDTHWADDDKGMRFYSGANLLLTVQRLSAGLPTLTSLFAPVSMHFYAAGTRVMSLSTNARFYNNVDLDSDSTYLWLGAGQDASFNYNGTNLLIDPDRVGTGKVYIGATADDDIVAANFMATVAGTEKFFSRAAGYASIVAPTAIELGDQTSGNYMRTTTTGLGAFGTCRWYDTRWLGANALKAPAANQATYADHGITGVYVFANGSTKYVHAHVQMPLNWAVGTDIILTVGWSSNTVDPGDDSEQAVWQMEALPRQEDEDTTAAAEVTDTVTASASQVADGMVISTITIPAANIDDEDVCIIVRLARLGGDGADTLGDTAELHGICARYLANELGPST